MASVIKQDIISWRTGRDLKSSSSASVILNNTDNKYSLHTENLIGQRVTLTAIRGVTEYVAFLGRVVSVSPPFDLLGSSAVSIGVNTIPELLGHRPITSETIESMTGSALLAYILGTYGGVLPAYFDVSVDNSETFSDINISENSLLTAVRKIADACNVEMFINRQGQLVTALKKDDASAVEYTLDEGDLQAPVSLSDSENYTASLCRVRGRYVVGSDIGKSTLVDGQSTEFSSTSTTTAVVAVTGVGNFTREQAMNALVTIISGDADSGVVESVVGNQINVALTGTFSSTSMNNVVFTIEARPEVGTTAGAPSSVAGLGEGTNKTMDKKASIDGPMMGRRRDEQIAKHDDEQTEHRIEVLVTDSAQLALSGFRYMTIDNVYIQDTAKATEIGERALFDALLSGRTLSAKGPFIPDLMELNTVVQVPLLVESLSYKCLLYSIGMSYNSASATLESSYGFVRLNNTPT